MKKFKLTFERYCLLTIALFSAATLVCELNHEVIYRPMNLHDTDYIFNVVDDSAIVYHNDMTYVGTVKLQGQLDSLIIDDNM